MKVSWIRLTVLIAVLVITSCSSLDYPSSPGTGPADVGTPESQANAFPDESRMLWGFYTITIDPATLDYEVIPLRASSTHWNILNWLEKSPCSDCFRIDSIGPGPGETIDIVVTVEHPFDNPDITGFDVRGIAMFYWNRIFSESGLKYKKYNSYSTELLNADGFTTLYNPETEGAGPGGLQGYIQGRLTPIKVKVDLSGYKRFISDDPANTRNAFYAGDTVSQTLNIHRPNGMVHFSYAVDACWMPPDVSPVTDPMTDFPPEANCEEPWKIETVVEDIDDGLTTYGGGSVNVQIGVYDYQGMSTHGTPILECPELYNGFREATFVEDLGDHSVWECVVSNECLPLNGTYYCLVSVEDNENDPAGAPWLDLTAYQIVKLEVSGEYTITDVTPPELKDALVNCIDVFIYKGYAYVTGNWPMMYILDISVPEEAFIAATYPTIGYTLTVVVENDIAYLTSYNVGDQPCGMILLDVTDPTSPQYISSHGPAYCPHGISGEIGVSSAGCLGFLFHDIDPPESAHYIDKLYLSDNDGMADILVLDGYAYALRLTTGLHIVDFDPIESAAQIGTIDLWDDYYQSKMDEWNDFLFIAGGSGVDVYDISDVETPTYLTSFSNSECNRNMAVGIEVDNGIAFVTASTEVGCRIELWDVDPPTEAEMITFGPAPPVDRFAVDGNYLYLTSNNYGGGFPFTILKF